MRKTTCRIFSFILIFLFVYLTIPLKVEAKTNNKQEEETVIEVRQINPDEDKDPIVSTESLSLFSQRLFSTKEKCNHKTEKTIISPSCSRYGYTVTYCKKCETNNISNFTPTTAHDFVEFHTKFEGKNELHRKCSVCGYEEVAEEQRSVRYFSKKKTKEIVWTSYQTVLEQRKIEEEKKKEEEEKKKEAENALKTGIDTKDSAQYTWTFLMGKIKNPYGVAGIMGNLYAESGIQSTNLEQTYEYSLGYTDTSYTKAVDEGKYKNFSSDCAGYGLAQWTSGGRKANLLKYAKSTNRSIGDLGMQLEFLWDELNSGYPDLVAKFKNTKSIADASSAFMIKFERPADQSPSAQAVRASYGQSYYDKYAKS